MTTEYKLADEVIALASSPDVRITKVGSSGFDVELTCNSILTDTQIANCILETETTISLETLDGILTFTGTISDLGTRLGYSKVILTNATYAYEVGT